MSVYGFKKQFNKASQLMNEKVLKASHTEVDESFRDLEKKTDGTIDVIKSLSEKVVPLLQPNPTARVKIAYKAKVDRARGQQSSNTYPHAENALAEVGWKGAGDLGEDSNFGTALGEFAAAMREIADFKESMDVTVNQNFIDPLNHFLSKEIKTINHHRKKMESRRLDFDGKRRKKDKGGNVPEQDMILTEEKFEESKELAETGMLDLLEGDAEQISQLQALVDAMYVMHQESASVLERLRHDLEEKSADSQSRPRTSREPRAPRKRTLDISSPVAFEHDSVDESPAGSANGSLVTESAPAAAATAAATSKPSSNDSQNPHCKALYDFEAENAGELNFEEGDTIRLTGRIDENWLEGEVRGKGGYFPQNYVEIIVDL